MGKHKYVNATSHIKLNDEGSSYFSKCHMAITNAKLKRTVVLSLYIIRIMHVKKLTSTIRNITGIPLHSNIKLEQDYYAPGAATDLRQRNNILMSGMKIIHTNTFDV